MSVIIVIILCQVQFRSYNKDAAMDELRETAVACFYFIVEDALTN